MNENKDALSYLLDQGIGLDEIQVYERRGLSLEDVAQVVKRMLDRGECPIQDDSDSPDVRSGFNLNDFETGRVFEYITSIKDPYEQGMEEERAAKKAGELGFKSFKKLLGLYRKKLQSISSQGILENGISEFGEQPFELVTGEWQATENGIWKHGMNGPVIACSHPIFPAQVLRSVDTGLVKIKLAYRIGSVKKNHGSILWCQKAKFLRPAIS